MVLKLPEQWYVGFSARSQDDAPLGFMTPEGTDKAAQKRKATVDGWRAKDIAARTIDNKKLTGFKLSDSVRRYSSWGNGNVKWRITDPRGFELEITSPNLMQILNCSTVEQGEILDACIWGREGADNILIPVTSELYKTAVADTKRQDMKVSLKDVKPGNEVTLQSGERFIFLGDWYQVLKSENFKGYGESYDVTTNNDKKKRYFLKSIRGEDASYQEIQVVATPKVATIDKDSTLTDVECFDIIMDAIKGSTHVRGPSYNYSLAAVSKTPAEFAFRRQDATRVLQNYIRGIIPVDIFGEGYYTRGKNFLVNTDEGKLFIHTSGASNRAMEVLAAEYARTISTPNRVNFEKEVIRQFLKVKLDLFDEDGKVDLEMLQHGSGYFSRTYSERVYASDLAGLYNIKSAEELYVEATLDNGSEVKLTRL